MLNDYRLTTGDVLSIDDWYDNIGLPLNYFNPDIAIPLTLSRTKVYYTKINAHNTVHKMCPEFDPKSKRFYSVVAFMVKKVNSRLLVDFKDGKMRVPKICR